MEKLGGATVKLLASLISGLFWVIVWIGKTSYLLMTRPIGDHGQAPVLKTFVLMGSCGVLFYLLQRPLNPVYAFAVAWSLWATVMVFIWLIFPKADDGLTPQERAGKSAEERVAQVIDHFVRENPQTQALHSQLLVFHEGTPQEFSAELDHVLITPKNLFVVETKYKSGTIEADPDAQEWTVHQAEGNRVVTMRNALQQVKNAARVLKNELGLSVTPLVVIVGENVRLDRAPSNVMVVDELIKMLDVFEEHPLIEQTETVASTLSRIQAHVKTDSENRQRHIARANQSREKAKARALANQASVT